MSEQESDFAALEHRCLVAASLCITRYGWQLLDLDAFAHGAAQYIRAGKVDEPQRAVVYTYSHALYTACSGTEGPVQQSRAYTELFHYLYFIASYRYSDVSEEALQIALVRTFERFDHCRNPGTFIAFAIQHLVDAARKLRRPPIAATESLATPVGEYGTTLGDLLTDERQPDPIEAVLTAEQRADFEQLVAAFLEKHPRATLQIAALQLKYMDGLDDKAISERLGKSVSKVHVLRHRAVAKLRADPQWRARARELGLLADGDS